MAFITASGATDLPVIISSSATWSTDAYTNPVVEIDWSQVFACGIFETAVDYKEFVNELHVQEHRKDLFRESLISPINTQYSQRKMNHCVIPAKRNFKGTQSRRQ